MAELRRGTVEVHTLFDLLGTKENDVTFSLGWALSRSDRLLATLLSDVLGVGPGDEPLVRLQRYDSPDGGFTDVEVQADAKLLIVEAKKGWDLPHIDQLSKYAARIRPGHGAILVLSECTPEFALARGLPREVEEVPVHFRRWSQIVATVISAIAGTRGAERQLLDDLVTYLRSVMTVQDVRSNMVRVVALNDEWLDWMDTTFMEFALKRGRLFQPVVGKGFPREPPNYFGFRFRGKLCEIRHVDSYEVVAPLDVHVPEITRHKGWMNNPHYLYTLGDRIQPDHEVRSTRAMYRGQHVEAAIDLLLTSKTIPEAVKLTRERFSAAGLA